jgi:hypothetical protein
MSSQARAGSTQTFSVLQDPVTGFSGGTVYEAAGADTVLTLQGPLDADGEGHQSYDGLLRLTGDGRIVLDMPFNNGGYARPSILVERSSTAELFGDNSQGLDLVIGGSVIGGTTGIAVDATYARRVELLAQKGFIGITGGTALKVGQGTEVLISNSTDLRKSGAAYGLLIDADGSTITNRSTIWEDSKTPTASSISTGVSLKEQHLHQRSRQCWHRPDQDARPPASGWRIRRSITAATSSAATATRSRRPATASIASSTASSARSRAMLWAMSVAPPVPRSSAARAMTSSRMPARSPATCCSAAAKTCMSPRAAR